MDAHLTSNLKPCPFCGCNDIEGPFPHNQLRLVWVTRCGNPSCEAEHMADSAEETCARWNRRTTQEARGPLTTLQKERNYKTHKTRMSDASSFDEICTECGATDFPGSDLLDLPCPKAAPPHEPGEIHRIALDGLNGNDVYAYAALTKIAMATDPSLSAPHEPQGWQPIETAPHMRKIIVHYLNALGKSRTVMACYYEKNSLEMHDDYEDVGTYDDATGMTWSDEGWYEEHDSENPIMALAGTPTHWMPLPSAPVTKLRLPFGMSVPAPGTKCDHGVLLEDECEACNSSTKADRP